MVENIQMNTEPAVAAEREAISLGRGLIIILTAEVADTMSQTLMAELEAEAAEVQADQIQRRVRGVPTVEELEAMQSIIRQA